MGLSFSVAPEVRPLPGSLLNTYREMNTDPGLPQPSNGDLTPWTEQAIRALARRERPLGSSLWGRGARNLRPLLGGLPSIESAHPSLMSADRGFFGSRPFSRVNDPLARQGAQPVDWRLP